MEPSERVRIEQLARHDEELRRLWVQHLELEQELAGLLGHRFPTPEEELRRKEIQKVKLAGMDRIQEILSQHR